jgi:hypothetical protein
MPFSLSDLACLYNVNNSASLFADVAGTTQATVNGPVGKILDLSGKGNHLSALSASTSRRPTLVSESNASWLSFDGTDDALTANVSTDFDTSNFTVYVGHKYTGNYNAGRLHYEIKINGSIHNSIGFQVATSYVYQAASTFGLVTQPTMPNDVGVPRISGLTSNYETTIKGSGTGISGFSGTLGNGEIKTVTYPTGGTRILTLGGASTGTNNLAYKLCLFAVIKKAASQSEHYRMCQWMANQMNDASYY